MGDRNECSDIRETPSLVEGREETDSFVGDRNECWDISTMELFKEDDKRTDSLGLETDECSDVWGILSFLDESDREHWDDGNERISSFVSLQYVDA